MSQKDFGTIKSGRAGRFIGILIIVTIFGSILMAMPGMAKAKDKKTADPPLKTDAVSRIDDSLLLGWQGKWNGVSIQGNDSLYMEVKWKLTDDGQWMEGRMSVWPDHSRKMLVESERIFIRPARASGEYKGFILGSDGMIRSGTGTMNGGEWDWVWNYDNGAQEKSRLLYDANGKIYYDGTVVDSNGQKLKTLNYDLTRPLPVTLETTLTSPTSD